MSRDKQIAEMARIACGIEVFDELDTKIAVEDGLLDTLLNLYNAGYRKASEIFEEIDAFFKRLDIEYGYFLRDVKNDIAELKKKYTEENNNDSRTN